MSNFDLVDPPTISRHPIASRSSFTERSTKKVMESSKSPEGGKKAKKKPGKRVDVDVEGNKMKVSPIRSGKKAERKRQPGESEPSPRVAAKTKTQGAGSRSGMPTAARRGGACPPARKSEVPTVPPAYSSHDNTVDLLDDDDLTDGEADIDADEMQAANKKNEQESEFPRLSLEINGNSFARTPATSTKDPPSYRVATLNLLGEASNPFEFLPLADDTFMEQYAVLEDCARSLVWDDVEDYFLHILSLEPDSSGDAIQRAGADLRVHCDTMEAVVSGTQDGTVWTYFQEAVLSNDNKILDERLNMLTMATLPLSDLPKDMQSLWAAPSQHVDGAYEPRPTQQWHLNRMQDRMSWVGPFCELTQRQSYQKDPNLFLWDLVCNIICTMCKEQHTVVAEESTFNAENMMRSAERLFGKACDGGAPMTDLAVVLGLQEWPPEGSARARVYEAELNRRGMDVVHGKSMGMGADSVAIAFSSFLGPCRPLTTTAPSADGSSDGLIRPIDIMHSVIEDFGDTLSPKDVKGLVGATSKKTAALRLGEELTVLVVHAKEPKTPDASTCLARFIMAVAEDLPAPWVAMSDTNMATFETCSAFELEVKSGGSWGSVQQGLHVVPAAGVDTTAKHRSLLHGQCYNKGKCLVTVKASKDRLLCGGATGLKLRSVDIYPNIEPRAWSPRSGNGNGAEGDTVSVTLPNPEWPSDHCLVSAVLSCELEPDSPEDKDIIGEEKGAPLSPSSLKRHQKASNAAGESLYSQFLARGLGPTMSPRNKRRPSSTTATAGGESEKGSERGSERGQSEPATMDFIAGSPERDSVDDLLEGTFADLQIAPPSPNIGWMPASEDVGLAELLALQAKAIPAHILDILGSKRMESMGNDVTKMEWLETIGDDVIAPVPQALSPKARLPALRFSESDGEDESFNRAGWSYDLEIVVDAAANVLHELWRDTWNREYPYDAAYGQVTDVKTSTRPRFAEDERPASRAPDWTDGVFVEREEFLEWFDDHASKSHMVRDRATGGLPTANTKTFNIEVDKNNLFTLLPPALREDLVERAGTCLLNMMSTPHPLRVIDHAAAAHDRWMVQNPGAIEWTPDSFRPFGDLNVRDKIQYYYIVQACSLSYEALQRAKGQVGDTQLESSNEEKVDEGGFNLPSPGKKVQDAGLVVIGRSFGRSVPPDESYPNGVYDEEVEVEDDAEEVVTLDADTLERAPGEGSTLDGDTLDNESLIESIDEPLDDLDTELLDIERELDAEDNKTEESSDANVPTPKASHLGKRGDFDAGATLADDLAYVPAPKTVHLLLTPLETARLEREALWTVNRESNAARLRGAGLGDLNDPSLLVLSVGRWTTQAYDASGLAESFPIGTDVFNRTVLDDFNAKVFSFHQAPTPKSTHSSPTKKRSNFASLNEAAKPEGSSPYNRVVIIGSIGEFCKPDDPLIVPLEKIASRLHSETLVEDSPYGMVCAMALKTVDGLLGVITAALTEDASSDGPRERWYADGGDVSPLSPLCVTFNSSLQLYTLNVDPGADKATVHPQLSNKIGDALANGGISLLSSRLNIPDVPSDAIDEYVDVVVDWHAEGYTVYDNSTQDMDGAAVLGTGVFNANEVLCVPDAQGTGYTIDSDGLKDALRMIEDKVVDLRPTTEVALIVQTGLAYDFSSTKAKAPKSPSRAKEEDPLSLKNPPPLRPAPLTPTQKLPDSPQSRSSYSTGLPSPRGSPKGASRLPARRSQNSAASAGQLRNESAALMQQMAKMRSTISSDLTLLRDQMKMGASTAPPRAPVTILYSQRTK